MDDWLTRDAPRRPRLRRGLAATAAGGSMLIEGGPSRQVLGGADALALIPRLLPALDGRHSGEQLRTELGLSSAQLGLAVRLLDQSGLVEWVTPGDAADFSSDHVAAYMSRTFTMSESCPSANDLARNLAASAALLVAPHPFAEPIAEDLCEAGVGKVLIMTAAAAAGAIPDVTGRCAAAIFDAPADAEALDLFIAGCQQRRIPVLRFHGAGDRAEIGPTFCGLSTACVECFRRGQSAEWFPDHPVSGEHPADQPPSAELTGVLCGLVTSALLGTLGPQPPAPPLRRLTRITLPGQGTTSCDVLPDLDCRSCLGGLPPADAASQSLLAYEWQMGKVTPFLEQPDATTPARRDRFFSLQRQRDSFPTSPRDSLPDQNTGKGLSPGRRSRGIERPVLAEIFARVAGFRPAGAGAANASNKRWAPSGGNVGSVALYLVTDGELFHLPGTVFRYDDLGHQVISVRADRVPLSRVLDGTDLDAAHAEAVIVLVGEVGRLREKYGDFAWRLTHLDTGCAALQLHLAAKSHGLRASFAATWPGQLTELLDLEEHDVITAIAGLAEAPGPAPDGTPACQ
jgi:SagB-type dehydrogenase family enzyme